MKKQSPFFVVILFLLMAACSASDSKLASELSNKHEQATTEVPPTPAATQTSTLIYFPPSSDQIIQSVRTTVSSGTYTHMAVLNDGRLVGWGENAGNSGEVPLDARKGIYIYADNAASVSRDRDGYLYIDDKGNLWLPYIGSHWYLDLDGLPVDKGRTRLMENVAAALNGNAWGMALTRGGNVWTWGVGAEGQLGIGGYIGTYDHTNPQRAPVKIMENVIMIDRCSAIKEDRTLWVWGYVGIPDKDGSMCRTSPTLVLEDVKFVNGWFAIKNDGSLWAWETLGNFLLGKYEMGEFYPEPEYSEPVKIMEDALFASGHYQSSITIIKGDNSLWVCGRNSHGQLGDGTMEPNWVLTEVMDDVVYAVTSEFNIYALKSNGELWEFGAPYYVWAGDDYTAEERLAMCLPHKIMDGILVP